MRPDAKRVGARRERAARLDPEHTEAVVRRSVEGQAAPVRAVAVVCMLHNVRI